MVRRGFVRVFWGSFLLGGLAMPLTVQAEPFDAAAWRAAKGQAGEASPRAGLLDALEREHVLAGWTRGEVHALLGLPDRRERRAEHYMLGQPAAENACVEYVVEYDSANHVAGTRRLCD